MTSRVVDIHRTRLEKIMDEAEQLEGAARNLSHKAREAVEKGGGVDAAGQMTFIVGCVARLLKDVGVVEQLQADGVSQKRRTT